MSDEEMDAYRRWFEERHPAQDSAATEGGDRISDGTGPIPATVSEKGAEAVEL